MLVLLFAFKSLDTLPFRMAFNAALKDLKANILYSD